MTFQAGQRWAFIHSSGARTEYVLVDPRDAEQMPEAIRKNFWAHWEESDSAGSLAYLLNPKTGKFAMVTHAWLRRPVESGVGSWECVA